MAFADILNNAVSTVTGEVSKARISFKDGRDRAQQDLKKKEMESQKVPGTSGLGSPSVLGSVVPSSIAGAIQGAIADKTGINEGKGAGYDKSILVQFNPSSIHLSGHAGDDDVQITNFNQSGKPGIGNGAMDLQMEMSVELIFDQTNNSFAFKEDLLSMGLVDAGRAVTNVAKGAAMDALTGNTKVSVQQIVESFIAIMRNENCRMVCFEWGDLKYEGSLRRLNTEYTMFDITGAPVRAKVRMSIYLVETSDSVLRDYSNGYWYDAYHEAFVMGNPLAETSVSMVDLRSV